MPSLADPLTPPQALAAYRAWLPQQPLAPTTTLAYLQKVSQLCSYLQNFPVHYANPFENPDARDYAVRDFKAFLQKEQNLKASSINSTLAALNHFYHFVQLGKPLVSRDDLPKLAPRALTPAEQKELLRASARQKSARDRAVILLFLYTAIRIGECCNLNQADANYSSRKGLLTVRYGKGGTYREIPLNSPLREVLQAWQEERHIRYARFDEAAQPALFVDRQGHRLSRRAIDLLLRRIGREASLSFSAHILRHTCLTNLVRAGNDLVLVAEIAGHKRLETTRRYTLPTLADRESTLEDLKMEF